MIIEDESARDLERLVLKYRKRSFQLARIPEHSGSVTKQVRKERRQQRTRLKQEIEDLRHQIVAWALSTIEPDDELEARDESEEDKGTS